jgi:hypothetical protein
MKQDIAKCRSCGKFKLLSHSYLCYSCGKRRLLEVFQAGWKLKYEELAEEAKK